MLKNFFHREGERGMECTPMLRLALRHIPIPRPVAYRPIAWQGAPWNATESESQSKASFAANRRTLLCGSLQSALCFMCPLHSDDSQDPRPQQGDHNLAGPGQAGSLVFPGQESLQVQASSFQEPTE